MRTMDIKFKAKILVIGPCEVSVSACGGRGRIRRLGLREETLPPFLQSGKTWISNFLAEATDSSGGEYHPTQGVRILEFESEGENPTNGNTFRAEVELWDCSGSKQ